MADAVHELVVTDIAAEQLGRRSIFDVEVEQLLGNANVTARNPSSADEPLRRLLIGRTDGGGLDTGHRADLLGGHQRLDG